MSWRSQNGSSRERSRDPSAVRSTRDSAPPNSASISTASSTGLGPASAAPSPVRNESVRAVARAEASSLVLPRPAAASMIATPPAPARTRSSKPAISCNCSSRTRIGGELPVLLTMAAPETSCSPCYESACDASRAYRRREQAQGAGAVHRLVAAVDAELGVHVAGVRVDRVHRQPQFGGDLARREVGRQETQDAGLAVGELFGELFGAAFGDGRGQQTKDLGDQGGVGG